MLVDASLVWTAKIARSPVAMELINVILIVKSVLNQDLVIWRALTKFVNVTSVGKVNYAKPLFVTVLIGVKIMVF